MKLVSRISRRLRGEVERARQAAVEARVMPGRDDYSRFVILTNIRCGSTMLTSYLSSHPAIRMFFELFHIDPGAVPFHVEGYERRAVAPEVVRMRNEDPVRFLDRYVFARVPPNIRAVGFKLLHTQARAQVDWWDAPEFADWWSHVDNSARTRWRHGRSDLWAHLRADRDLRVILLTREDPLQATVSAEQAKLSGRWGIGATGGADGAAPSVVLDASKLVRDFEAAWRQADEAKSFFEGHPAVELTYEQLVADPLRSLARVQELLGTPPANLSTKTRKLQRRPLSEVVSNWDEVRRALAGTRWEELAS